MLFPVHLSAPNKKRSTVTSDNRYFSCFNSIWITRQCLRSLNIILSSNCNVYRYSYPYRKYLFTVNIHFKTIKSVNVSCLYLKICTYLKMQILLFDNKNIFISNNSNPLLIITMSIQCKKYRFFFTSKIVNNRNRKLINNFRLKYCR